MSYMIRVRWLPSREAINDYGVALNRFSLIEIKFKSQKTFDGETNWQYSF